MNPQRATQQVNQPGGMGKLIAVMILAALVGAGGIAAYVMGYIDTAALVILLAVLTVVEGIGLVVITTRRDAARVRGVGTEILGAGLTFNDKLDNAQRERVFKPFRDVPVLHSGSRGVRWGGRGKMEGRKVEVCEHTYAISTGQATVAVTHLCAATPCPESWPRVSLAAEDMVSRIGNALGFNDIELENGAFNDRWRIHAEDEAFVRSLLTARLQAWLVSAPKSEMWTIGDGWAVVCRTTAPTPTEVGEIVRRPGMFMSLVKPELLRDAWAAAQ